MQITSLVVARRQEDRAQISTILVSSIGTLSVVSVAKSNTGIWVSVPAREGISTPLSVLASEYRYQLPENSFWNSLKLDFLHLGPIFAVYDSLCSDDVFTLKLHT
ncbi:hypothetical protein GQ457_11G029260 [Hibiscus cannabinus]